jgi:hypothetical protein
MVINRANGYEVKSVYPRRFKPQRFRDKLIAAVRAVAEAILNRTRRWA